MKARTGNASINRDLSLPLSKGIRSAPKINMAAGGTALIIVILFSLNNEAQYLGYNNETGLLEVGIKDAEYYERELLYKTHLTNQDLIEELKVLITEKERNIYAN